MNTDQTKTNLEEAKDFVAAKADELKDKVQYAADQTSDKAKETFYAGRQDVRAGVQDVKDKARECK